MQYILTEDEYQELMNNSGENKIKELLEENAKLKQNLDKFLHPKRTTIGHDVDDPFQKRKIVYLTYHLDDFDNKYQKQLMKLTHH